MQTLIPFVLVPLVIYTYFWINPLSFATFWEGILRYLVEVYLGYKAWKIERQTNKAYKRFQKNSLALAKRQGFEKNTVKLYFKEYGQLDWNYIKNQLKEMHERKFKDLEDNMREMILY
jgi:hypothetical protein